MELVRKAQAGDAEAFRLLYEEHVGRVYALCLRLERDAARAEELTQDAFVRAWEALEGFRGEAAFSTWLHRLTVNVVLSSRRSLARRARRFIDTDDAPAPARAATPGLAVDLERALQTLPDGARTVFVLHDVEGYRHGEIATMLGVAEGTSKAQLFRARRLLREVLTR